MSEKFQKIVNLKDQASQPGDFALPKTKEKAPSLPPSHKAMASQGKQGRAKKKTLAGNRETVQAQAIEEMFADTESDGENSLHKIVRAGKNYDTLLKRIGIGVLVVIFIAILFTFFSRPTKKTTMVPEAKKATWSAVALLNGEVYYGSVVDVDKNPVVINNVYYDYDQADKLLKSDIEKGTSSLRLVKKGKESYGPDGSMIIYQSQIKYVETLKDDSKVLNAILDHEKQ